MTNNERRAVFNTLSDEHLFGEALEFAHNHICELEMVKITTLINKKPRTSSFRDVRGIYFSG
jgi:hypothetical protein